ncbi:Succinate-semialdehyde dehydrogenase [NADP(+)] GabD [Planctomycetes bacterium Pan216]|uniref:Succinate-semialdehyde dehydrogenase [NADP(+)] GabD n=1 Tax=Kolteria novifilia TaxID=2527975 RepID=A0A518BBK3_9BACT|nr:Succinate-semialdehyde dehydrogenase [NADP(+)] GabD [Planctomycetes bacterium Pan216]
MATMILGGERVDANEHIEVTNPFDGSVVDVIPKGTPKDVERALSIAEAGAVRLRKTTAYERYEWLQKSAQLLEERRDDFARTISLEEGKTLGESLAEVSRSVETLVLSAEEAKRLCGEAVPLEGASGGKGRFGFTIRVPCGIVVAISPFNFPLNLVAHKLGPAIAGGNSVILKPASDTPLSGIKLVELMLEAGVPSDALQCITGSGGTLSDPLCGDRRVRKISFTGSFEVGDKICRVAGMKKVTMELGSNSPLIVMDDADLEKVIAATLVTGYGNAGQVCISTQRVLVDRRVYADYLDGLKAGVEGIVTGNPLLEETKMGPMIRQRDAERVTEWLSEAVTQGGELLTGSERDGAMVKPAIIAGMKTDMKLFRDELFGPAVGVMPFDDIDEAIAAANDTRFGLSAGIFTENIGRAMKFAQEVDAGTLQINWGPAWRVDLMPYGGLKDSGMGKEGPSYAIREMTEEKMVVMHL